MTPNQMSQISLGVRTTNLDIWDNQDQIMSQKSNCVIQRTLNLLNTPKLQCHWGYYRVRHLLKVNQPTHRAIRGVMSHLKRQDHLKEGNL